MCIYIYVYIYIYIYIYIRLPCDSARGRGGGEDPPAAGIRKPLFAQRPSKPSSRPASKPRLGPSKAHRVDGQRWRPYHHSRRPAEACLNLFPGVRLAWLF